MNEGVQAPHEMTRHPFPPAALLHQQAGHPGGEVRAVVGHVVGLQLHGAHKPPLR